MAEYDHKIKEKVKAMLSEIKENVLGINTDGEETGTQINGMGEKEEIPPEQNKKTSILNKQVKKRGEA